MKRYIAFLRGINVGGHHKVPMADLRAELVKLKLENVITILNSGNVIFEAKSDDIESLQKKIAVKLEKVFGFSIPTILRPADLIDQLLELDPFKRIEITKDIRLYVSFLQNDVDVEMKFPWSTEDGSFKILCKIDRTVVSILDLSITNTPKGMEALEKMYGKDITTRNWKTILRLEKKLAAL